MIVFLIWLWISNIAVLFGAEFDAELERSRELAAGLPAEESFQLPNATRRRTSGPRLDRARMAEWQTLWP